MQSMNAAPPQFAGTHPMEDMPGGLEPWTDSWPQTPEAFEALVQTFMDRLVRYAFRRLGDFHEAEDVVQEVFIRGWRRRLALQKVESVRPYLYRMTANACTDLLRKRRGGICSIERIEEIPGRDAGAQQVAAAAQELQRIEALVEDLPPRQAEVIRLRFLDDLPLVDVARIIGCSRATAKSRLRYGLQKLRQGLSRQGGSER